MKPVNQMQAKDIPDDVFLGAVLDTPYSGPGPWRFRDDVKKTLERMLGHRVPEKLFLAKARKLGQQQKLEGCTDCTCRGDYHLPFECYLARCCYLPDFDWTQHPDYLPEWVTIAARFRAK